MQKGIGLQDGVRLGASQRLREILLMMSSLHDLICQNLYTNYGSIVLHDPVYQKSYRNYGSTV